MKYQSIWQENSIGQTNESLNKDIVCDVLIIGGGITGVTTAFYLRESGLKVALVERRTIGSGASGKSTAKINYLQDILAKINQKDVSKYLKSQREAINLIVKIIEDNHIKCDLKQEKAYLFGNTESEIKKIKKIECILKKNNIEYEIEKMRVNIEHKYAISVNDTYTFNPIKYLNSLQKLLQDTEIYENTFIKEIGYSHEYDCYVAYTNKHKIKAKRVVIASWYPFFLKPFFFPLKARLEKSYLACFETEKTKRVHGINLGNNTKSFRYYQKYFVYLINSHIICNGNYEENFEDLLKYKPAYIWSNIDIITNDHMPFIGELRNNLYLGTGYNTWGNTNATLAGKILSDLVLGQDNKYKSLFNPKRKTSFQKIGNNLINSICNIKGYIKGMFTKREKVYYSDNAAIYIDKRGKKYCVKRKCPHLYCDLIFNYKEKTWDCPCHASRFDIFGNCIFGPSNENIKIDTIEEK